MNQEKPLVNNTYLLQKFPGKGGWVYAPIAALFLERQSFGNQYLPLPDILKQQSLDMDNKTKVSILMAVYNTDFALVKRAIDSVLNQTFQNFELLIIDDGSDNDPQNQLLGYAKKYENKITYLRHKNCGQSQSINRGILNSKSEYLTILDADDEYEPNHLWSCLQEMEYADLIASTTKTIVDKEEDYYVPDKHDTKQVIHVDECILFATLFGKRKVFANLKFQDFYAADADFYERAGQQYNVRKVDLRTYVYYRNIPGSICATLKSENSLA